MHKSIAKLFKNRAKNQFYIRSVLFFGSIFVLMLFIQLYFRRTDFFMRYLSLTQEYYLPWMSGLVGTQLTNAALFTIVAFIIYNKSIILDFKEYAQKKIPTIAYALAAIIMLVMQYVYKYLVKFNPEFFSKVLTLTVLTKYFINIMFVVFLALAIYGWPFIRDFFVKFKKQIPIFIAVFVAYYFIIEFTQGIWFTLSLMVTNILQAMLGLTFSDVFSRASYGQAPVLGADGFIVGISKDCSGVDSLILFLSLYVLLILLDWKRMHVKRMLFLFIPGLIGTVIYNILRIYLLMIVGILIDPEFAVDVFHTNIGWVLFLVFFVIFWHFASKWVYKKKIKPKNRKGDRKASANS